MIYLSKERVYIDRKNMPRLFFKGIMTHRVIMTHRAIMTQRMIMTQKNIMTQ